MERLSYEEISSLNEAIGRIYSIDSPGDFYTQALEVLHQAVSVHYASYNEFTPSLKAVKLIPGSEEHRKLALPHLGALEAHFHLHPLRPAIYGNEVKKISDFRSTQEFHETPLYGEYYRHVGVTHQIFIPLPRCGANMSLFALNRNGTDFTESERTLLTLLRPHFIRAYRNALELSRFRNEAVLLEKAAEKDGRGAVIFAPEGTIEHLSPFAGELLSKYSGGIFRSGQLLPENILAWVQRQISANDQSCDRQPLRVENEAGRLRIQLVRDLKSQGYMLVLSEEEVESSLAVAALGLTGRETQVLQWVANGKTNLDIAYILRISERTVEKHLENIFRKLGVETRTAAAALIMKKA